MICPQCDGLLGGGICQGCGWREGNPWPAHRLVAGSTYPLRERSLYPAISGVKDHITVAVDVPVDAAALATHADTVVALTSELAAKEEVTAQPVPPVQTLDNLAEITRANAEDGETPAPVETPAASNAVSETPKPKLDPNIQ